MRHQEGGKPRSLAQSLMMGNSSDTMGVLLKKDEKMESSTHMRMVA